MSALNDWRFRRADFGKGDEFQVVAPSGNCITVGNRGRLCERILFELAQAMNAPPDIVLDADDLAQARVPEGWVLVPREPTGDMLDAMLSPWLRNVGSTRSRLTRGWKGAIAVSPTPESREAETLVCAACGGCGVVMAADGTGPYPCYYGCSKPEAGQREALEALEKRLADHSRHERHRNVAERDYWILQWKTLASDAIATARRFASAQQPSIAPSLSTEAREVLQNVLDELGATGRHSQRIQRLIDMLAQQAEGQAEPAPMLIDDETAGRVLTRYVGICINEHADEEPRERRVDAMRRALQAEFSSHDRTPVPAETQFHKAIRGLVSKRKQGQIMGAFREARAVWVREVQQADMAARVTETLERMRDHGQIAAFEVRQATGVEALEVSMQLQPFVDVIRAEGQGHD